jgi:hypothetical protein
VCVGGGRRGGFSPESLVVLAGWHPQLAGRIACDARRGVGVGWGGIMVAREQVDRIDRGHPWTSGHLGQRTLALPRLLGSSEARNRL